jgi:hypothetical protein
MEKPIDNLSPAVAVNHLVKKLENKYNEKLVVNTENLNSYFTLIAKNRNAIKDLKDRNKNFKLKCRGSKDIFSEIFFKKNKITKIKQNNDNLSKLNSKLYEQLNSSLSCLSLVNTNLFEKLYMKVLFKKDGSNDDEIYDVFSLWYYLKNLKNLLIKNEENCAKSYNFSITLTNSDITSSDKYNSIDLFISNFIIKALNVYLEQLFLKSKNKKSKEELNEEEIFGKEFYTIYESFLKIFKIKYMKVITGEYSSTSNIMKTLNKKILKENLEMKNNLNQQQKEELGYLKSIYSLISNNGSYSYQICKKI